MFHLSVFSTILLILAVFALLILFFIALKMYINRRSSQRYEPTPVLTYHIGSEESEQQEGSILKSVFPKLCADIKKLFSRPDSKENEKKAAFDKDEAKYANQAEHDMVATLCREEQESFEKFSNPQQGVKEEKNISIDEKKETETALTETPTGKEPQPLPDNSANGKTDEIKEDLKQNQKINDGSQDLTSLFSMAGNEENNAKNNLQEDNKEINKEKPGKNISSENKTADFAEIRRSYLSEKKQRMAKTRTKRKQKKGETMLSQEEASVIKSVIQDLVSDFDSLDNDKVIGRLKFAKKKIEKK